MNNEQQSQMQQFSNRYSVDQHGKPIENGKWMMWSAIFEMITSAIVLTIIIVVWASIDFDIVFIVFLLIIDIPLALVGIILLVRYIRHNNFLKNALPNGTVVIGQVDNARWSFWATALSLGGWMWGGTNRIQYTYIDEIGRQQSARGFVRGFLPPRGQQLFIITHNGRSAIIDQANVTTMVQPNNNQISQ